MSKTVLVLGGDGFCGWPTSLHLSALGYEVVIVDNFVRRRIAQELDAPSLTPITSIDERLNTWKEVSGRDIDIVELDIARDYSELRRLLASVKPDAIVHFAEQRAAPYSMRDAAHKIYTVDNNIGGTHHVLAALAELKLDAHLVHLGTMGVYGYESDGLEIPEGYLQVRVEGPGGANLARSILHPTKPGSIYHLTKSMDQLMFQFYARNDRLRITDLHQGIVWGTQTEETRRDPALINRFDYDGDYGTVLNRFLMQAAAGHPLTVHGTGGQTRAFIHIQDTVRCIALALDNPPAAGDPVRIINQVAETRRVRDLAELVSELTGAHIEYVDNPRKEAAENELAVSNATLKTLGLEPILLTDALMSETVDIAARFIDRANLSTVPATAIWSNENAPDFSPLEPPRRALQ